MEANTQDASPPITAVYAPDEVAGLPAPVVRWFGFALRPGQPLIRTAHIRQEGSFARKRGVWCRFRARESFTVLPPAFSWDARIRMSPLVSVRVRDSYRNGEGVTLAKMAGIITLANQRGTPEIASASLLRYLAETPWLPTALLPCAGVAWDALDDTSARATLVDAGITVSMDVRFGTEGQITSVSARRYRDEGGRFVLIPWKAEFRDWVRVDGMRRSRPRPAGRRRMAGFRTGGDVTCISNTSTNRSAPHAGRELETSIVTPLPHLFRTTHKARTIGLGCMRLSTAAERDDERAIAVILAALDAGATLLDTADAYARDDAETGHNERLIAEALRSWPGGRDRIVVATKGGLRRPGGRWVPDGRAKHLRAACEASLRALATDAIDLYQLHAPDPRTPFETSVRALAALQREGLIRRIGLSNVTVHQIEVARAICDVAAVQVPLGVFDDETLRNGVAEYCRDHDIALVAYRPLGGNRAARVARDAVLREIAARHDATPHEIALAWLLDLDPHVVPIPGATRVESARSLAHVLRLSLTAEDRAQLDARFPAGRRLRMRRSRRRPPVDATGEVVLVMGMPAAGKSTVARALVARGHERLNRDARGGRLSDLVDALDAGLAVGRRRWVLDNTYATRASRNDVIECSWKHGVPVRCVWLTTPIADAQINAVNRLLGLHGRLPSPEELRARCRDDPRWFGPDAQFRYERSVEPPSMDEGFTAIEERAFAREPGHGQTRAIVLDLDDLLASSSSWREGLATRSREGWALLVTAWRPGAAGSDAGVSASFAGVRSQLGTEMDFDYCAHPAGPPICWCRKPLPGLVLLFAHRRGIDLRASILAGTAQADRTLATRLGMTYMEPVTLTGR